MTYLLITLLTIINIVSLITTVKILASLEDSNIFNIFKILWDGFSDSIFKSVIFKILTVTSMISIIITIINMVAFPYLLYTYLKIPMNIVVGTLLIADIFADIIALLLIVIFFRELINYNLPIIQFIKYKWKKAKNFKTKSIIIGYIYYIIMVTTIVILNPALLILK